MTADTLPEEMFRRRRCSRAGECSRRDLVSLVLAHIIGSNSAKKKKHEKNYYLGRKCRRVAGLYCRSTAHPWGMFKHQSSYQSFKHLRHLSQTCVSTPSVLAARGWLSHADAIGSLNKSVAVGK